MNQWLRSLFVPYNDCARLISTDATARANHKQQHTRKTHDAKRARPHHNAALENVGTHGMPTHNRSRSSQRMRRLARGHSCLSGDLALVKEAIDLARKAKTDEATPQGTGWQSAAQKLVEWFILRHSETTRISAGMRRSIAANPNAPAWRCCGRRAEARLWQERSDAATVRALRAMGHSVPRANSRWAGAAHRGRSRGAAGWPATRGDRTNVSERLEAEAYETFRDLLTREDHRARMDMPSAPRILAAPSAPRSASRRRACRS